MSVLYVSDLDGTLLNSDIELSEYTINTINNLIDKGMNFTFATARSLDSSYKIVEKLKLKLPVIVYNGVFIMKKDSKSIISSSTFTADDNRYIQSKISRYKLHPLVYTYIGKKECVCWDTDYVNEGISEYLLTRKNSERLTPTTTDNLYRGNIFYYTIIDSEENLRDFYNEVKSNSNLRVMLQKDIYNDYWWCEILPANASKANGILQLRDIYGFDRIVSFGDAINDIPMFSISDECYAVENASPELKDISTGELLSNNNDGVAHWLEENFTI